MDPNTTISVIGAEGTGKSTLCDRLAAEVGGVSVVTPEWPSFQHFLKDPKTYGFQNQIEALSGCLQVYNKARHSYPGLTIFLDMCPDRIHLVHSWLLKQRGFLSDYQWEVLQAQYVFACEVWPINYIYLRASENVLQSRLAARGRMEDFSWNCVDISMSRVRWEDLLASDWRQGKNLLELSSEVPVEVMIRDATQWCRTIPGLG